jgi:Flp pilus assembly protein TadD
MTTVLESLKQAVELHRAGRRDQAEQVCRWVLEREPDHAQALHLLGTMMLQSGRAVEARLPLQRAAALEPDQVAYHATLASALIALSDVDEAMASMRRVLGLRPDRAEAHNDLGVLLACKGQLSEAEDCFRQTLRLQPNHAHANNNLGNLLNQQGHVDAAIECFCAAKRANPSFAQPCNNLASAWESQGKLELAIVEYREAVRVAPDYPEGCYNLGRVLHVAGQSEEGLAHLARAVELRPTEPIFRVGLAGLLIDLGRLSEAEACCQAVLQVQPDHAAARYLLGTVRLARGDFSAGWLAYEARLGTLGVDVPRLAEPQWGGEPLDGRTLLIHCEQGLGDTLQFIRYVKLLGDHGGKVVIAAHAALVPLLAASGFGPLVAKGGPLPRFDVQTPLLSLPRRFGTDLMSIPGAVPYLAADAGRVERWRAELAGDPGLRVGIIWQGRPGVRNDRQRSIPLAQFAPLALPGVRLMSLQKGAGSEQLAQRIGSFEVLDLGRKLDNEGGAFLDTAAVMKTLDLVITSDTAAAHLAGGLGVPVWVALSAAPEWRWLLNREDSPWYPTMRLFRQRRLGDWPELFQRMAAALSAKLTGRC